MKDINPELSIIVPVYNVEKYLKKCINNILEQTYKNFELILVNDGSSDSSGVICDYYRVNDSRVKVIHQSNRGASAARNEGLKLARGIFVCFLDADDYIEKNMFELLVGILKHENVDVVVCGFDRLTENGKIIDANRNKICGRYSQHELIKYIFSSPNPIGCVCWNKIFRWKNPVYYDETITYAEDWLFLFNMLKNCESGIVIKDTLYHYVEHKGSITNKSKLRTILGVIEGTEIVRRYAKGYSSDIYCMATEKYLDNCVRYGNLIDEKSKKECKKIRYEIKARMWKTLIECVQYRLISTKKIIMYIYLSIKI